MASSRTGDKTNQEFAGSLANNQNKIDQINQTASSRTDERSAFVGSLREAAITY